MPLSRLGDTTLEAPAPAAAAPEFEWLLSQELAAELRLDRALAGGEQLSDRSRFPLLCTQAVVKSS